MTGTKDDLDRPFWRSWSFILAATFVGLVVAVGAILLITGNGDDREPPTGGEATATPTVTPTQTDSGIATERPPTDEDTTTGGDSTPAETAPVAGQCDTPPGTNDDILGAAPQDVQWSPVGEVAAALSPENGPAVVEGVKECFANTPTGALLAAYNFYADLRTSSFEQSEVVESRVLPPHRETLLDELAGTTPSSQPSVVIVGYRVLSVEEDTYSFAFVSTFAASSGSSVYIRDIVEVRWEGSDWFITATDDPQQVDGLPADHIEWGPLSGEPE